MKCHSCKKEYDKFKEEKKIFSNNTEHIGAYCPYCNHFVKWLPQGLPDIFYFGKYKGEEMSEVAKKDKDYLIWMSENNPKLKRKIVKYL